LVDFEGETDFTSKVVVALSSLSFLSVRSDPDLVDLEEEDRSDFTDISSSSSVFFVSDDDNAARVSLRCFFSSSFSLSPLPPLDLEDDDDDVDDDDEPNGDLLRVLVLAMDLKAGGTSACTEKALGRYPPPQWDRLSSESSSSSRLLPTPYKLPCAAGITLCLACSRFSHAANVVGVPPLGNAAPMVSLERLFFLPLFRARGTDADRDGGVPLSLSLDRVDLR
jgi:hypothetical protein